MKSLMRYSLGIILGLAASTAGANFNSLTEDELTAVNGQGGADLMLDMKLNGGSTFDNTLCNNLVFCRIAVALNNRYHDGTQDTVDAFGVRTPSPTGKKEWLVFKGVSGQITIQEIKLDGTDVTFGATTKAAIKLSFDANKPILIRNFGFQSLSIATDTVANEGAGNLPGYLDPTDYAGGQAFDLTNPVTGKPREKGFLGVTINGNLAVAGNIKMFGCDSTHPRC
jgi:hypothetical protein